jgi:hypothetical protein
MITKIIIQWCLLFSMLLGMIYGFVYVFTYEPDKGVKEHQERYDRKAFEVWEKYTDNPKHLTYEEFMVLYNRNLINKQ